MSGVHVLLLSFVGVLASGCGLDSDGFTLRGGGEVDEASSRALETLVNDERRSLGLPAVPLSASLAAVARAHVLDLESAPPSGECNLHSWSSRGEGSACCYTDDHARAECMWDKPRELTSYAGSGFEIAHASTGRVTARGALSGWRGSRGHYDVIVSRAGWADSPWRAMGAAVSTHYAVVWFGEQLDCPHGTEAGGDSCVAETTTGRAALRRTGRRSPGPQAARMDGHGKIPPARRGRRGASGAAQIAAAMAHTRLGTSPPMVLVSGPAENVRGRLTCLNMRFDARFG